MKVIDYIKEHGIDSLKKDFGIDVKEYEDRYVLNYNQIDSPQFNPVADECRALILSKDLKVLSRSFRRFYNYGQDPKTEEFDILRSSTFEKIDGSLMPVYHDGDKWCVQTRKMAFAEGTTVRGNTYHQLFLKALNASSFEDVFYDFPKDFTYVFEFVSPETRVVKLYNEYKIFPLAVINNEDGYDNLFVVDWVYNRLKERGVNVELPKIYFFKSYKNVIEAIQELDTFDEGYVCFSHVDHGWRIKIKSPAYLAIAHMRNNGVMSEKRVCELILSNDQEEYLLSFPEDREYFEPYIEAKSKMFADIERLKVLTEGVKVRKDYAMIVKDSPVASIMFKLLDGYSLHDILMKMNINVQVNILSRYVKERILKDVSEGE